MKKMAILTSLIAAVLVTTYSVSGTYAKYTSTFEGETATARVAKWAFAINNTDLTTASNDFEFNLFDTVLDEDGSAETDIVPSNTDKVIAPGTKGSFEIELVNNSEVNAEYTVTYDVNNPNSIPVEFSIDGENWTTSLANVAETAIASGADDSINIRWRWTYDTTQREAGELATTTNDGTDTLLGENGGYTLSVQANIVVTQVN